MPAGIVRTEVVSHGVICMADGYILIFGITGELACSEKQVEIHHIVYDDREIPRSEVP